MLTWIRHGDVGLVRVLKPHKEHVSPKKQHRIVLAEGEVTGHAHVLDGEIYASTPSLPNIFEVRGGPATLKHEEHATVEVPEGVWEVRRQREFWGEERRVVD